VATTLKEKKPERRCRPHDARPTGEQTKKLDRRRLHELLRRITNDAGMFAAVKRETPRREPLNQPKTKGT